MPEAPSAYFLIAHGSQDLRSRHGLEACAKYMRQQTAAAQQGLPPTEPWVGTGVLEFGDQPLATQMADFAKAAAAAGVRQIFLLPLFLAAGNHLLQDLPQAIQDAQGQLDRDVLLTLCPALGAHPHLSLLVKARMREVLPCDRWILLAHGSKRPGGNQPIETLAAQLDIAPAYWATAPALEDQIQTPYERGAQRIGIAPYFLFAGRITDAIEAHVVQLRSKFLNLDLQMTQPLNPSPLMAKLLLESCTADAAVQQCSSH